MTAVRIICVLILLMPLLYDALETSTLRSPSHTVLSKTSPGCKLLASANYNLNIQNMFDQSVDLVYLKWTLRYDDDNFGNANVNSYLQQENDIIDPFVWTLSRGENGQELLSYPFDYRMLSLGTLGSGVSKVAPFQVTIPTGETECFRRASDSERLEMMADLFLSTTTDIIQETSDNSFTKQSVCVEKHSRRSPVVADVYVGTHVALQMSSSYLCWTKDVNFDLLNEFEVQVSTPWLRSIMSLEPTWYLMLFVLINFVTSVLFVYQCRYISKHVERSDSGLDTIVRCARFLSLVHVIPTAIVILTYYDNYCKRRDVARKFSSLIRAIDVFHFIISVCIINLPWLYRKSLRFLSRRTLLLVFFIACVFTSTCANSVYVLEVLYFTILGLIRNPKTWSLVILHITRSILIIRAVLDLHTFLRFESGDQTLLSFLIKRAVRPDCCFFFGLSLLHVCLDPYNISPVTAALLSAAFINWIWYKFAFFDIADDNDPLALHEVYAKNKINSVNKQTSNETGDQQRLLDQKRQKFVCQRATSTELFAGAYYDSRGGYLAIEGTDIGLFIPPGALEEEQFVYIAVMFTEEHMSGLEERNGVLLSPIVICGPPRLQFEKKIQLFLPHVAKDLSDWDIEASYCQIASPNYSNWTRIHQEDFNVYEHLAVISVGHFTRFGMIGFPRALCRARKTMQVSCFGCDLPNESSTCHFRVWICDGTKVAFKKIEEEEKKYGLKSLFPPKPLVVPNRQNINIRVRNIKDGWANRDNTDSKELIKWSHLWRNSRRGYSEVYLDFQDSNPRRAESVHCSLDVTVQESTLTIHAQSVMERLPTREQRRFCCHMGRRERAPSTTNTICEKIVGEITANIGRIRPETFYDMVTSLGCETVSVCDWRKIIAEIEEQCTSVFIIQEKYKNSYASAKFALEYYLTEAEKQNPGHFDPVEELRRLFQRLELYDASRHLERQFDNKDRSESLA